MEKLHHARNDRDEDTAAHGKHGQAAGRGAGEAGADGGNHDKAGQRAPAGGGGGGGGEGAGAWEADGALMDALGLGGGGPAAGGGGQIGKEQLEGIVTPPKGQAQGLATPEAAKQLQTKKFLQLKAGVGGGGGEGGESAASAAPAAKAPAMAAPSVDRARPGPGSAGPASGGGGGTARTDEAPAGGGGGGGGAQHAPTGEQTEAPQPAEGEIAPAAPPPSAGRGVGSALDDHDADAKADGGESSVEAMIHTLEHGDDATARKQAAIALGKLGKAATKARPALEKAARDPNPMVAKAAHDALKLLG